MSEWVRAESAAQLARRLAAARAQQNAADAWPELPHGEHRCAYCGRSSTLANVRSDDAGKMGCYGEARARCDYLVRQRKAAVEYDAWLERRRATPWWRRLFGATVEGP